MSPKAYFEISPSFETHWTGIPAVTAGIARQAIEDPFIDWTFFYHSLALPSDFVRKILLDGSGKQGTDFLLKHCWGKNDIPYSDAKQGKALFLNIKPDRDLFAEEAVVVYDLSPLLTPQFHSQDSVNHFANRFRSDVTSSARFFCISKATRDDLISYFNIDPNSAHVLRMGVDIDPVAISAAQYIAATHVIEPYVVVLGTLEPRKNGRIVLQYLAQDPGFANRFRIVFIGRDGWLDERQRLMTEIKKAGLRSNRIVFTGYIDEVEKFGLLYNSAFCIYSSFFEGYGLPILEAAVLGKLIVCSNTSSMPEVSPDRCFFFDPLDLAQFSRAISLAEKRAPQLRSPSALPDITERLKKVGWEAGYAQIAEWVRS